VAATSRAQDRAQLRGESLRMLEQQLDATLPRAGKKRRRLVFAEVENADRGDTVVEELERGREGGEVLVLAWPRGSVEERKLRPEQAHTVGLGDEAFTNLHGRRRIAEQRDPAPVACHRWQRALTRES